MEIEWVISINDFAREPAHFYVERILSLNRVLSEDLRPAKFVVKGAGIGDAVAQLLLDEGFAVEVKR